MTATPCITHVMEPVLPGAAAVLTAGGAKPDTRIYGARLTGTGSVPPFRPLKVLHRDGECVTVDIPAGPLGAWALAAGPDPDMATAWIANRPRLDWHFPAEPVPGEELRLLGRNIVHAGHYPCRNPEQPVSYGGFLKGKTRIRIRKSGATRYRALRMVKSSGYEVWLTLPCDLEPGTYDVQAHNGLGGSMGWSDPLPLCVAQSRPWPKKIFRVDRYLKPGQAPGFTSFDIYGNYGKNGQSWADDAIRKALDAARRNGGGIVEFSGRIYDIRRTIVVPPRVVLRGQGSTRTWLRTPFGGGIQPPYVVITGDRDFVVEDLRIVAYDAPVVVCVPLWVPKSMDEAFGQKWHMFPPAIGSNVTIRRCYIHQRPAEGWIRRQAGKPLSKFENAYIEKVNRHMSLAPDCKDSGMLFTGIQLRAQGCRILDTQVHAAQHAVSIKGCRSLQIARNTLYSGAGGNCLSMCGWADDKRGAPVKDYYLREILIEDNELASHSIRSRNGFFFYQSGYLGHAARNRIVDVSRSSDGEAMGCHLWMDRVNGHGIRLRMVDSLTAEIDDPDGRLGKKAVPESAVEILDGTGTGQIRQIVVRKGNRIRLERPWRVPPDKTSLLSFVAPPPFHKLTFVDNYLENTGASLILWGSSHDLVVDGNRTAYGPGIGVWSCNLAKQWSGIQGGAVFTQVIHNTLDVGMFVPDRKAILNHYAENLPQQGAISNMGYAPEDGFDFLGLVIRGNCTRNNSAIMLAKTYPKKRNDPPGTSREAGVVVEGNMAVDSVCGIVREAGVPCTCRRNRARGVQYPLVVFDRKRGTVTGM